jgi:protein gp37
MNKTKIEWCDRTLNPIVGCPQGCNYCYARLQAKRQKQKCQLCYEFKPHQHLERLEQLNPNQKPLKIFIDSMWDWNSKGIKEEWLKKIITKMKECPQHKFLILSKHPKKYSRFLFPSNIWLGTSISNNNDLYRIKDLNENNPHNKKFVSIEPIHEKLNFWFSKIDWMIIGAETGKRINKIIPQKEWIKPLINNAKKESIPIFIKNNIKWSNKIQEFPETIL